MPLSEESEHGIWLLDCLQGVYWINLGSAAAPLGLYNQLPDNCIATSLKSRLLALAIHTLCDIHNLHEADNLRRIEISAKPGIMHGVSWPTALARLQRLTVCKVTDRYVMPNQWQHYTQLRGLRLPNYEGSLPVWFSNLQQLTFLSMPDAQMDGVPEGLFQLSELKHLDLNRSHGVLTMPVVKLATLLQLTYLNFAKLIPHYEQAVLLDLGIALSKRELKLKKVHLDECTFLVDTCQ